MGAKKKQIGPKTTRKMSRAEKTWRKKYVELLKVIAGQELQESATDQQIEIAKDHGKCLAQMDRSQVQRQRKCTHRKGGIITNIKDPSTISFALAHGNSMQYAVLKHRMINRDIWVRCLRCGKWWKPPCRSEFKLDRDYWKAMFEYEEALEFPTNNATSGSVLCNFHQTLKDGTIVDANEVYRQRMANFR